MITVFPAFKKLELSDKPDVDALTKKFPSYSDFEFGSMWAWDVKGEMMVAQIHSNLAVKFTDYLTGEPFFSLLGATNTNESVQLLLDHASSAGIKPTLRLVPEIVVATLDPSRFSMAESREHFDYIYAIESHVSYDKPALKKVRNILSAHRRRHTGHTATLLDLSAKHADDAIADLCARWEKHKKSNISNEIPALRRFLKVAPAFQYMAVGIMYGEKLAAISVTILLSEGHCNCLFAKADIAYHGIYALLMHETAKILIQKGYQFMNYEQDLGIPNLRKAKMAFNPTYFLKKYTVAFKPSI